MEYRPRQEYLQSLGLDWNESNVIYGIAARIDPVKDMTTLVKAFAKTVQAAPNARLLIAGIGDQEEEIKALAAQTMNIKKQGLKERPCFCFTKYRE